MIFLIIVALFFLIPIAEIYVLLSAGDAFGIWPVIAACLGTAILGGAIIRMQGAAALNTARKDLNEGRPPVDSAVDGALLVVAAPFLMTPGFLTDFIGFCLLTPPIRRVIGRMAMRAIKRRIDKGNATITINRP
ncbi:MAG: FxsA family protein [Marinicaulis sp.]|nr:FxsA family protein [Marinicaulis sp.]NNE41196.1 FxsA family protein [Marinicaulis sp.]NNL88376.1 FxsA family protein [Marinicaulis sp.]